MRFDTLESFIHMDGHGVYVWLAYGISIGVLLLLVYLPILQHRQWLRNQQMIMRRENRSQDNSNSG